jgi:hypothetical protein
MARPGKFAEEEDLDRLIRVTYEAVLAELGVSLQRDSGPSNAKADQGERSRS